jgi:hypothetical protein
MSSQKKFAAYMAKMPALRHSFPDREFEILESQVVEYIMAWDDIHQYLFNRAIGTNRIKYQKDTGCWSGVGDAPDDAEETGPADETAAAPAVTPATTATPEVVLE